jgi:hypothetical protein
MSARGTSHVEALLAPVYERPFAEQLAFAAELFAAAPSENHRRLAITIAEHVVMTYQADRLVATR